MTAGRDLTRDLLEYERLESEKMRRAQRYVPHRPHAKQREFLACTELEALYGGAAGGGKTDALLMAAAEYIHVPGHAALLLRRTYPDLTLPQAILDRAKQWWIPAGVAWSEKDKRFTFPSGATITFGYCDTENDKYRYQGAELQFLGIDELTQWPEGWYRYLLSRLRRPSGMPVPLRARATSNPGGIGHEWVKRRFVEAESRAGAFIPAGLADNPHTDRDEYRKSLSRLDPTTRKQLEEGVWIRDGGGLVYGHFDDVRNVVKQAPERLHHRMLGLDFGIEDENAVAIVGWREHDTCLYVLECYRKKAIVSEMCEEVRALERGTGFETIVGDTGGMGKAFTEEMRSRYQIPVTPAEKTNKLGYISLLNDALATGGIRVVESRCRDLIDEWKTLPWNEARTKESDGFDNHAADALLYVWRASLAFIETAAPKPKTQAERDQDFVDAHWNKQDDRLSEKRPWWDEQ